MKQLLNSKLNTSILEFERMSGRFNELHKLKSRSVMSFGKAYKYAGVEHQDNDYNDAKSHYIKTIGQEAAKLLFEETGIKMNPNSCIVNIYEHGKNKMGFHSDDTEQLVEDTGVIIVSLGDTRTLAFRQKGDIVVINEFDLDDNSIFYMDAECQEQFEHAILANESDKMRVSLSYRELKE